MLSPKLPLPLGISSPWKEDRAMAIGNMHKDFVKDRACGSGDTPVDRQTDRQTDRHTLITILRNRSRGQSNEIQYIA